MTTATTATTGKRKSSKHTPATPQEAQERRESLRTQGRAGAKLTRINMGFTPSNITLIRILARARGATMTQTVNDILATFAQEHPELLERIKATLAYSDTVFTSVNLSGEVEDE